ncbi:MAG: glycosyltransferase family 4 protein [Candidatus Nanoarchaeia archaeon]|nr:glycosyltransferase family 4 protein [Candidatus Nanoarchaeia archaeon]
MSKEIIWNAPIYDPSGYASCAREYIWALHKLGVTVKIEPVVMWSAIRGALTDDQHEFFHSLEQTPVSKATTKVQHTVPDCYHRDKDFFNRKCNIGYTVFETDMFPKSWKVKMDMMNKIFVPTEFNLKTFKHGGFDPNKMVVIPHIVDTEKMNPEKYEPMKIKPEKEFYFLSIMDFTKRKGWDILLKAYLREFKNNRNVGLILKAYYGGNTEVHRNNLMKRIQDFKNSLQIHNPPDIIFFGHILTEIELYSLYKSAHAFVYPSRGEGWGLCISEAMAMEVPVIVTNWSGHLDFCKPDNSYLIDVLGFEETDEEMIRITPNYEGQKWATPSEEHLRKLMRQVYEHHSDAKARAKLGRQYLKDNFGWKLIGEKIIEHI